MEKRMSNSKLILKNTMILLMGFPGVGKRTVANIISQKTNARFSDHHDLIDPILKLLGDDYQIMWDLTPEMWDKINAVIDVYLSTISDVCAKDDSFILTEMLFDKDPYHQAFYDKVISAVKRRQAHFIPVRLICDEDELVKRVLSEDRKLYFKTRDADLSRKRSKEEQVFYSNHSNEITIDTTSLFAEKTAEKIIQYVANNHD